MPAKVRSGLMERGEQEVNEDGTMNELIKNANVLYCLDCGKCTGACPVSVVNEGFSPRRMVEISIMEPEENVTTNRFLWDCLTCAKCLNYCPEEVHFPEFVRSLRKQAMEHGSFPITNHGGITSSIANAMADLDLRQNRLGWVKEAKVSEEGEILLFTGCLPYFDLIFDPLKIEGGANVLYNAARIMNHAQIIPAVTSEEVCCGHDQIWAGEETTFRKLMEKNLKAIERTGAKRIVTTCPECASTLKRDYADFGGVELDVVHITEFIVELLEDSKIAVKTAKDKVTYQDPCRLAQHLGILDGPRDVIRAVNPNGFVEMKDSRELASCCGTALFRNCDSFSEAIRDERLRQAAATGAKYLLTACPKCQIHFRCTLSGKCEERGLNPNLQVKDIVTYVAENLEKMDEGK